MTKIGVISDTHNLYCPKVKAFLECCDEIWHAGDIGSLDCADQILSHKPMIAVHGNIDDYTTKLEYPLFQQFERDGMKILMTHIGGYPAHYERAAREQIKLFRPDIFISGHSHILRVMNDSQYNLLHINPGACGCNGFHRVRTAIRLSIAGGKIVDLEVGEWDR